MSAAIIIPARFGSTRFPGKPLTRLSLKDGSSKSLIELSWEAASKVKEVDRVYIATDHLDIKNAAEKFGAQVIMTSVDCENGTSRCAEAVKLAGIQEDLIVNFQGDAPLTPHHFVSSLVNEMKANNAIKVATPILQCSHEHYQQLLNDRQNNRVGATTVVFDKNSDALYFSKEVLPFVKKEDIKHLKALPVYHHVGVYVYRSDILSQYKNWKETTLEKMEGLEQLRFLRNNVKIRCKLMKSKKSNFWELNNPSDKKLIEEILRS